VQCPSPGPASTRNRTHSESLIGRQQWHPSCCLYGCSTAVAVEMQMAKRTLSVLVFLVVLSLTALAEGTTLHGTRSNVATGADSAWATMGQARFISVAKARDAGESIYQSSLLFVNPRQCPEPHPQGPVQQVQLVPEPTSLLAFGSAALLGLGLLRRKLNI